MVIWLNYCVSLDGQNNNRTLDIGNNEFIVHIYHNVNMDKDKNQYKILLFQCFLKCPHFFMADETLSPLFINLGRTLISRSNQFN